tara:strand:- start:22691 stop:22903 length:213 start_codon:yes stop_codon:yes gene_type:complete
MKIVKFNNEEDAIAESNRLIAALNLPNGMSYGEPFLTQSNEWALKVKEDGNWPSIDIIQGTIEDYSPSLS